MIPLTAITKDMKQSQTQSTNIQNQLDKLENLVSRMGDNLDKTTKTMIVFLRKASSYFTFRISLLTIYFKKAKASIQGTINNIKEKNNDEFRSKSGTNNLYVTTRSLNISDPNKIAHIEELWSTCANTRFYNEEYKPAYDELSTLLNAKGDTLVPPLRVIGSTVSFRTVKNPNEKINVKGRTLYHTVMGQLVGSYIYPSFRTASGELFPEPRIYVHASVPLNRYANKPDGNHHRPYVIDEPISEAYRDPEMGRTAMFIKTDHPIKAKEIDIDQFTKDTKDKVDLSFNQGKKN
jgi:hypothetical protein